MVPGERLAFCVVTRSGTDSLHSVAFGDPSAAWAAAAGRVGRDAHPLPRRAGEARAVADPDPVRRSVDRAKGFYKVEPVVADGGQVVLYAPHIHEISAAHPQVAEVGYHCRRLLHQAVGPVRGSPLGAIWPTPPTCAAQAPTTKLRASAAGSR